MNSIYYGQEHFSYTNMNSKLKQENSNIAET